MEKTWVLPSSLQEELKMHTIALKYPCLLFYHLDSDVTYRDLPDPIQIKLCSLNLAKLLFAQMQSESKAYFSSKRQS